MIKSLYLLFLFFILQVFAQAQSPFNYGKARNIYFLSQKEIRKAKIVHIYTVEEDKQRGNWAFFDIGFNQYPGFYNHICQSRWDSSQIPPLDTLIAMADDFRYSSEYSFEGDKISSRVDNSSSMTEYRHHKAFTIAETSERQIEGSTEAKINYYRNGAVHSIVCCKWLDGEARLSESGRHVFRDTTYYFYDRQKRVMGYIKIDGYNPKKVKARFTPIFKEMKRQHETPFIQAYIGKVPFEKYIDHLIGYRPKLLLFEIYQNAVLPFQYDGKRKRYIECEDIRLE